jgi:hypothetical protein
MLITKKKAAIKVKNLIIIHNLAIAFKNKIALIIE